MDLDVLQKLNFKECLELVRVMNASIPDSLYVWDLDEDKVYYTRSISKNYVLQPKESIGFELQELLNLTYPLDRPKIEKSCSVLPMDWNRSLRLNIASSIGMANAFGLIIRDSV